MVEQNSPVIFSDWLKIRRKALDLTQVELAERAGCSVSALRKIESGERRPSKQLAELLAQALEIPNEDLRTFVRVARGELNIERMPKTSLDAQVIVPDVQSLRHAQFKRSLDTKPAPPSNRIPIPTTSLIGRDVEFQAMDKLFSNPQCRLLTLTGIGGIGKTRLAIEFGLSKLSTFPGGVYYVPLTPVNSAKKIVSAIADVLDFRFSGPSYPKEQLLNYLSSSVKQEALFIFDNFEHLLVEDMIQDKDSSLTELIAEILRRLPNFKILGTSRERLNLHGEWMYELHGLSVPPVDHVGRVEQYDSIALFIKSAQRVRADFHVSEDEKSALVRICQLVEGVPLAIELAAAWVGILSCQEIAQEIQSNMDFLTTSMRDIPERHRSIRATFDHSWKLLSNEEREALCQLAVFKGGFDRQAAQQVVGASLNLLASLSAKSLLHRTENERYDLHEVIRQYALSHLNDHGCYPGAYIRHCEYYLNFLRERENSLKTAAQQETIQQLTNEIDNIRSAWIWAINHKNYDQLELAGRAFGWYFEITGLYREGIEQLELLVGVLKSEPRDNQRQRVLGLMFIHQALLNFRKGEFDQAQNLYEESILILRPIGDQALLADGLIFLGTILHLNGEYDRSKSSLEEGLLFSQESNDIWFEAFAIYNLGYITSLMGHPIEGYEQMVTALGIWRALGDPHAISLGLNFLIPTINRLGRYEEAIAFMEESIVLCEQSKNRWGMGTAYRFLGLAYSAEGEYAEAREHLLKSLEIFGEFSIGWDIARSLSYLGDTTYMLEDFTEARNYYLEALRLSIDSQAIPIALDALLGIADLQEQADKPEFALAMCYFILDHPSSEQSTKERANQLRAVAEPKLKPMQIRMARDRADRQTLDMLVSETLEMG